MTRPTFHRHRRLAITAFGAAVLACCGAGPALAQEAWPTKPLRIVVGYPPASSPDVVARLVAEPLGKALGTTVTVENRPGAGGNLGLDAVLKATDNHTIGITTNGPLTTSKQLYAKLPFDAARDAAPLSLAATSPLVFVTDADLAPKTMKDFLVWARAQKDGVTYGSIGQGSGSHLTTALFAAQAGVPMVHVPFQSFPQVTTAIVGHQVQTGFMAPSGALAQAQAGKLRLLGVSSAQRSPLLPDVPTVAEAAGISDFRADLWIAAIGPASLPPAVQQRLADEISRALKLADVQSKLLQHGWQPLGEGPEALRRRIAEDTALWTRVIQQAGIRIE